MRRKNLLSRLKRKVLQFDFDQMIIFGYRPKHPHLHLVLGYLSYTIVGTILLSLPFMTTKSTLFIDNLFSATSAMSTTGLSTVNVADQYTVIGKIVLLMLIQFGGLGYMTMSCFVRLNLTRHFTLIKRNVINAEFALPYGIDLKNMLKSIVWFTLLFESVGVLLLYIFFSYEQVENPFGKAVFHSVSSFCTAGFSTFSEGLVPFKNNWGINMVIIILSYAGALGFIVSYDIWKKITTRNYRITFTSRIITIVTLLLSALATFQMFFFEKSFADYPVSERFLVSFFQSVSALTTVGFNSVNIGAMMPITLLTLTVTMYFGASPTGTGGGLKTTTLTATYAFVKSKLGMNRDVTIMGRRIPSYRVETALATFILYSTIVFLGSFALTATESFDYLSLLFESASALGTVGLSTGITSSLTASGKIILVLLMFIGRVGVLTFGYTMLLRMQNRSNEIQKEDDLAI